MRSAWRDGEGTRVVEVTASGAGEYRVTIDGVELELEAALLPDGRLRLRSGDQVTIAEVTAVGDRRFVRLGALDFVIDRAPAGARPGRGSHAGGLESPMPGIVTRVAVAAGDEVRKGQPLLTLEAMKMEHVIRAPRDGKIRRITASPGEMVNGGVTLVEMEEAE